MLLLVLQLQLLSEQTTSVLQCFDKGKVSCHQNVGHVHYSAFSETGEKDTVKAAVTVQGKVFVCFLDSDRYQGY